MRRLSEGSKERNPASLYHLCKGKNQSRKPGTNNLLPATDRQTHHLQERIIQFKNGKWTVTKKPGIKKYNK